MKNFILIKNQNKKTEKSPDYQLNVIQENAAEGSQLKRAGVAWKKQDKNGNPMLSGFLNDADEYGNGFHFEEEQSNQPAETQEEPPAEAFDEI